MNFPINNDLGTGQAFVGKSTVYNSFCIQDLCDKMLTIACTGKISKHSNYSSLFYKLNCNVINIRNPRIQNLCLNLHSGLFREIGCIQGVPLVHCHSSNTFHGLVTGINQAFHNLAGALSIEDYSRLLNKYPFMHCREDGCLEAGSLDRESQSLLAPDNCSYYQYSFIGLRRIGGTLQPAFVVRYHEINICEIDFGEISDLPADGWIIIDDVFYNINFDYVGSNTPGYIQFESCSKPACGAICIDNKSILDKARDLCTAYFNDRINALDRSISSHLNGLDNELLRNNEENLRIYRTFLHSVFNFKVDPVNDAVIPINFNANQFEIGVEIENDSIYGFTNGTQTIHYTCESLTEFLMLLLSLSSGDIRYLQPVKDVLLDDLNGIDFNRFNSIREIFIQDVACLCKTLDTVIDSLRIRSSYVENGSVNLDFLSNGRIVTKNIDILHFNMSWLNSTVIVESANSIANFNTGGIIGTGGLNRVFVDSCQQFNSNITLWNLLRTEVGNKEFYLDKANLGRLNGQCVFDSYMKKYWLPRAYVTSRTAPIKRNRWYLLEDFCDVSQHAYERDDNNIIRYIALFNCYRDNDERLLFILRINKARFVRMNVANCFELVDTIVVPEQGETDAFTCFFHIESSDNEASSSNYSPMQLTINNEKFVVEPKTHTYEAWLDKSLFKFLKKRDLIPGDYYEIIGQF